MKKLFINLEIELQDEVEPKQILEKLDDGANISAAIHNMIPECVATKYRIFDNTNDCGNQLVPDVSEELKWKLTNKKDELVFSSNMRTVHRAFTTNLGDYVKYKNENSGVEEGYVKLVNMKGINVSTPYGDRFVKWVNVLEIDKSKSKTWNL